MRIGGRSFGADEEVLFVDGGGDGDVEEADHHFVGGLVAPADGDVGIGIVRIAFGVVEPGDGLEFGSTLQGKRLGEAIAQLPVKIVIHAEERLDGFAALGFVVDDVVFEFFAAQMHVREKAEKGAIVRERAVDFGAVIGIVGRNDEPVVRELQGDDALRGRLLGENEADAGLVAGDAALGDVMHLKNKIGAGGDEFCHSGGPVVGRTAGRVDEKYVAVGPLGVAPVLRVFEHGCGERNAHGRVLEPFGVWRANINDGVMDVGAAGRADFGLFDPFVFGEVSGHDLVGVFHVAGGGNGDGGGHGDDVIGLRDDPTGGPKRRRRRVAGTACGSASISPSGESCDLLRGERWIVGKMAAAWIGKPRRHDAAGDVEFDLFGEAPGLRVRDKRHGRDFAGAVAGLAMLLEDGENVFIERGRRSGRRHGGVLTRKGYSWAEHDEDCEKSRAGCWCFEGREHSERKLT